tara:strand:+ start:310 stop:771 length:462 start_codon:yes stop_codon:yes gene_type:complete
MSNQLTPGSVVRYPFLAALAVMFAVVSNASAEEERTDTVTKSHIPIWHYTIEVATAKNGGQVNILIHDGGGTNLRKATIVEVPAGQSGTNICWDHPTEPGQRRFTYYITSSQTQALIAVLQNAKTRGSATFSCWVDSSGTVQMQIRTSRDLPQ